MGNVGTPRFYVNIYEYLESIGTISIPDNHRYLRTNPTKTFIQKGHEYNDGHNDTTVLPDCPIAWKDLAGDKGFVALLGHNMASCNAQVMLQEGVPDYTAMYPSEIVNSAEIGGHPSPEYDGFTIWKGDFSSFDQKGEADIFINAAGVELEVTNRTMQFRWESGQNWGVPDPTPYNGKDLKCNSIVIGSYYDMPHSPDLNLKLSYSYGGINNTQTKSGSTFSNAMYTKPADWGERGAWQLGDYQNYRTGKRIWNLSFTHILDSDIMPLLGVQNYTQTLTEDILNGTDFFSQVWNKTLGNALPFIFQPDVDSDEFAICKFKSNSLDYNQVALNVYDFNLIIEEVW